jgi:calmodulin
MANVDIESLRAEFEKYDTDNDGRIDLGEFTNLVNLLSPNMDPRYIKGGFSLIDENADGLMSFDEFSEWWPEAEWDD